MEGLGLELRQEANVASLTAETVNSWAIEGEALNVEEVRSSLARRLGLDLVESVAASRHIDGITEMMLDAAQRYAEPLTAERLFAWHGALSPTGSAGLQRIRVGSWRKGPMHVVSGPVGRDRLHFAAPEAHRLEAEMDSFLQWFDAPSPIDPVLRAGLAHLWFITIHPFDDGNGRIARALTDLALARADQSRDRYYSISAQIEGERKAYYAALESQQRSTLDITPWLTWFLGSLGRATEAAGGILGDVLNRARFWEVANNAPLNERQRRVLTRMLDGFDGHLSTAKYAKLAKCSPDTALRDIRELLGHNLLVRNSSGGRSTSYRLATADELGS
jgi:Fic family protein